MKVANNTTRLCGLLVTSAFLMTGCGGGNEFNLTRFVDPFVGTADTDSPATNSVPAGSRGGTFPGATVPFGMVQWTPMTPSKDVNNTQNNIDGKNHPIGYIYNENIITGFPLTQMSGAGCDGNSGEVPIMPTFDEGSNTATTSTFAHSDEIASPGFYSVVLGSKIKVELTTTTRTGIARFTYPSSNKNIAVNVNPTSTNTGRFDGAITKKDTTNNTIQGYATGGNFCNSHGGYYKVFFSMHFKTSSPSQMKVSGDDGDGNTLVSFSQKSANSKGTTVLMKVGISYVSVENAEKNLIAENPNWDFDTVRINGDESWNKRLNSIRVGSGSGLKDPKYQSDYKRFYTALYHSMLSPNINSDTDGSYVGFDNKIHKVNKPGGIHYANFSNWDIYRSQMPMTAWLFPKEASEMIQSTIDNADVCGALPRWSAINQDQGIMPGDSGVPLVASAYAFGAHDFDVKKALQYMKLSANSKQAKCTDNDARDYSGKGLDPYLQNGYVPADIGGFGPGSWGYEFVAGDAAIASFAKYIGDSEAAQLFSGRALNWKNNYDETMGMLNPRNRPSPEGFDFVRNDTHKYMVEGNAMQYNFMNSFEAWRMPMISYKLRTPYKAGYAKYEKLLDKYFNNLNAGTVLANFYIGNEPSFAGPWLYNWIGTPSKTQKTVHSIIYGNDSNKPVYGNGPGGLPGNDDLGATSSWLAWAMIGLYPSIPSMSGLSINGPAFEVVDIKWADGTKELRLDASSTKGSNGRSVADYYIQSVKVDGVKHDLPYIRLDGLKPFSEVTFAMGATASEWGGGDNIEAMPHIGDDTNLDSNKIMNNYGVRKDGEKLEQKMNLTSGVTSYQMPGLSFDGIGASYSEQELRRVGVSAGEIAQISSENFIFPSGKLNNIVVNGQRIYPSVRGPKYRTISILGSATSGRSSGSMYIRYSDDSLEEVPLSIPDWVGDCGMAKESAQIQNSSRDVTINPVLPMNYRLDIDGNKVSDSGRVAACMYRIQIELNNEKHVNHIQLPVLVDKGRQHIFAFTFGY